MNGSGIPEDPNIPAAPQTPIQTPPELLSAISAPQIDSNEQVSWLCNAVHEGKQLIIKPFVTMPLASNGRPARWNDLEYFRQVTGARTITDALKHSIGEVANRLRDSESNGSKMKALLMSDFVGCATGPSDLSENYKQVLDAERADKHGLD